MTEAKVIDMEMNEDGVMEQKPNIFRRTLDGLKENKTEILKGTVRFVTYFGAGTLFGYLVLPGIVDALTKPETVAEVAEAVVEATV